MMLVNKVIRFQVPSLQHIICTLHRVLTPPGQASERPEQHFSMVVPSLHEHEQPRGSVKPLQESPSLHVTLTSESRDGQCDEKKLLWVQ